MLSRRSDCNGRGPRVRSRTEVSHPFQLAWLSFLLAIGNVALGQAVMPDAQIESNVLKALAGAPELADEAITTRTVYGTVTLSGSVLNEDRRSRAENLVAGAIGVVKVVDELSVGEQERGAAVQSAEVQPGPNGEAQGDGAKQSSATVLQSDGTYASTPSGENGNDSASAASRPNSGVSLSTSPRDAPGVKFDPHVSGSASSGQIAGRMVNIPAQTMFRVRINRNLSSDYSQPGTVFDGILVNDVVADDVIAVPRGATVQGRVVEAQGSAALHGRGEMSIELTHVILGGRVYPIHSDLWTRHGGDKTLETVNKTAGFGAVGAVIGAIAGGGVGAAIGGGVGAAAGLGSSAASGNGQVSIPAEGLLTFHLAQAAAVTTVSEMEMQRLAYGAAAGNEGRVVHRRRYPAVYLWPGPYPGYYPTYYGPYGYPRY